jgi:hypothetical protein
MIINALFGSGYAGLGSAKATMNFPIYTLLIEQAELQE